MRAFINAQPNGSSASAAGSTLVPPSQLSVFAPAVTVQPPLLRVAPPRLLRLASSRPMGNAWWAFALTGVMSLAFPVLATIQPPLALWALGLMLAATVMVEGMLQLAAAAGAANAPDAWWLGTLGGLGVAVGSIALMLPPLAIMGVIAMVAVHAVIVGLTLLGIGIQTRQQSAAEWMLYLAGAAIVGYGVYVVAHPQQGAMSIVTLAAIWAAISGVLRLQMAWHLKMADA